MSEKLSRRNFFKAGALTVLGTAGAALFAQTGQSGAGAAAPGLNANQLASTPTAPGHTGSAPTHGGTSQPAAVSLRAGGAASENPGHAMPMFMRDVDHTLNGFNPSDILTDFDYGKVSTMPNGQTLREYDITVFNKEIEIAPGILYQAWTYDGRIPGPTIRCTEGDHLRITLFNGSSHPHSMHFHGVHSAEMDGVPGTPGVIAPGESFTYEFDAEPFGLHLYHCHVFPVGAAHRQGAVWGVYHRSQRWASGGGP